MKKIMILLVMAGITAVIVLFPDAYYAKKDEKINSYHEQETYNLNRVDNIDLQKKLEVLTDEDSVYINKATEMTGNDEEMIGEIINQMENILQRDLNEAEITKMVIENGLASVQVINSSAYNVYSVDLGLFKIDLDEYDFIVLFDAGEKKILYAEVLCTRRDMIITGDEPKIITAYIKNYYGEFTNWNSDISDSSIVFYIGSEKDMNLILENLEIEKELDYDQSERIAD